MHATCGVSLASSFAMPPEQPPKRVLQQCLAAPTFRPAGAKSFKDANSAPSRRLFQQEGRCGGAPVAPQRKTARVTVVVPKPAERGPPIQMTTVLRGTSGAGQILRSDGGGYWFWRTWGGPSRSFCQNLVVFRIPVAQVLGCTGGLVFGPGFRTQK